MSYEDVDRNPVAQYEALWWTPLNMVMDYLAPA